MTSSPRSIAEKFFAALETHTVEQLSALLAEDVVEEVPFALDGGTAPYALLQGKDAVMSYHRRITSHFERIALREKTYCVDEAGGTVFVETRGDLVQAHTGTPYQNRYVFKFTFQNGLIVHIAEYANPVTLAKLIGQPLG